MYCLVLNKPLNVLCCLKESPGDVLSCFKQSPEVASVILSEALECLVLFGGKQ